MASHEHIAVNGICNCQSAKHNENVRIQGIFIVSLYLELKSLTGLIMIVFLDTHDGLERSHKCII